MELKKKPQADLENHTKQFMLLGLILALLLMYIGIEWKTFDRSLKDLGIAKTETEEEVEVPLTERIQESKPPPPPPPTAEVIEIVKDNNIQETILESTETNQSEVVELRQIEEVVEEEVVVEDVPFAIIEEVPTYPGCKGNNAEKKACLQEKIEKLVANNFNTGLANELGLAPGKKKVYVMFKIDKNGNVTDIQARGPHARLEKEAVRVVEKIPQMTPGKQRNRPVGVKYTLPITLVVE